MISEALGAARKRANCEQALISTDHHEQVLARYFGLSVSGALSLHPTRSPILSTRFLRLFASQAAAALSNGFLSWIRGASNERPHSLLPQFANSPWRSSLQSSRRANCARAASALGCDTHTLGPEHNGCSSMQSRSD